MSTPSSSTPDTSDGLIIEKIEPTEEKIPTEADILNDEQEFDYLSLQDLLGLDRVSDDQKEKLNDIWQFFSDGKTMEEAMNAIADVRYNLTPPEIGESYLHKMWAYTNILKDIQASEGMKKAYERRDRSADNH